MSPKQIARNMEHIKKLRQLESDAFFAKQEALRIQVKAEADRMARATAAALRQSDYWAPQIKESLLAGLETR
jgi:hypothetical protein